MKFKPQQGVALVITLVMLSVITFLTIAFLTLSRRDRASVTTSLSHTDARYMADAALARAQAEAIAGMIARSNRLRYDLMVSRNIDVIDTTNPNTVLNSIANDLLHDPRPPVFIDTNTFLVANPQPDFRFFLDFNRNGLFETNGFGPILDDLGQILKDSDGNDLITFFVGDPEWIGMLERPEYPHSATNRFIGRYAFIKVPVGKTLDLNHIHNSARRGAVQERFLRNQGVGSWEINLAGFLNTLNPNVWATYNYAPFGIPGPSWSFEDAGSLLNYRYDGNRNNLDSIQALLTGNAAALAAFNSQGFDGYSDGPDLALVTTNLNITLLLPNAIDDETLPWSGSDNPLKIYDVQELFDPGKTTNLARRLLDAGTNRSSFDRYTFYRMLSQMGLETGNEDRGKIHLNYDNRVQTNALGIASATNFIAWRPVDFFQQTADRLLNRYRTNLPAQVTSVTPLSVTNLPFYIQPGPNTNILNSGVLLYTPEIHRLLQMAANIYDATHSNAFPTVFRPRFRSDGGTNFIDGYVEETGITFLNNNWTNYNATSLSSDLNVYRIPLVIGAKKGLPNFNEFSLETIVDITRKVELHKAATNTPPFRTNQMYLLSISNVFGIEAWNSYTNNYPRTLDIRVHHSYEGVLTNEIGTVLITSPSLTQQMFTSMPNWPGSPPRSNPAMTNASFFVPFRSGHMFLTNSQYMASPPRFVEVPRFPAPSFFENPSEFPLPSWTLVLTNRVRFALIDNGRIVDFVHLSDLITVFDISRELMGGNFTREDPVLGEIWNTNRLNNTTAIASPTRGIRRQIRLSMAEMPNGQVAEIPDTTWNSYSSQGPSGPEKNRAIDDFRRFMLMNAVFNPATEIPTNLVMQTPFNPTRKLYYRQTWQANDPLVHYTVEDLIDPFRPPIAQPIVPPSLAYTNFTESNLGRINDRYEPWGGKRPPGGDPVNTSGSFQDYYYGIKDPGVRWSDDWDFPTNKFPNIGWLGRVHRGTPWQTIYLKNEMAPQQVWTNWTVNAFGHPTNDWRLVDLFTTALNDNASRGQLSVNQTNYAAWSAVLSGVVVLENPTDHVVIAPDSPSLQTTNLAITEIVDALNALRETRPGQVFERVGEILAATNLTVNSPFIDPAFTWNHADYSKVRDTASDALYERIPQQILSLLRVGEPRFLIYAYGQSLKPADRSIVVGGQYFNLSTNYQITGEVATRTVLRVEGAPRNPRTVIESYNVLYAD
jgi:hypothetical protein